MLDCRVTQIHASFTWCIDLDTSHKSISGGVGYKSQTLLQGSAWYWREARQLGGCRLDVYGLCEELSNVTGSVYFYISGQAHAIVYPIKSQS